MPAGRDLALEQLGGEPVAPGLSARELELGRGQHTRKVTQAPGIVTAEIEPAYAAPRVGARARPAGRTTRIGGAGHGTSGRTGGPLGARVQTSVSPERLQTLSTGGTGYGPSISTLGYS